MVVRYVLGPPDLQRITIPFFNFKKGGNKILGYVLMLIKLGK